MNEKRNLVITGVTVSAEFGDKSYGNGQGSFMNVSTKCPDHDGVPLDKIDDVITDSLDAFFACWKTLLATRFAAGIINAAEFKKTLQDAELRLEKVRKFLRREISE